MLSTDPVSWHRRTRCRANARGNDPRSPRRLAASASARDGGARL